MQADQLVSLFETMYAVDGSMVTVDKVSPAPFAKQSGLHFEFSVVRKDDDLCQRGVAWVAIHKDELFAAAFAAPKLSFFERLLPKAERVVASATIKR